MLFIFYFERSKMEVGKEELSQDTEKGSKIK